LSGAAAVVREPPGQERARYEVEACDSHREPLKNVRLIRRADN
jgi:hypothetical protein